MSSIVYGNSPNYDQTIWKQSIICGVLVLFHNSYGSTERWFGTGGGVIIPWSNSLMVIREWYTGFGWYYQVRDGLKILLSLYFKANLVNAKYSIRIQKFCDTSLFKLITN